MASVNKVILVGNLGKDPEVRYMSDGGAVVNLSIATSSSWKDKNTGEKREETEWHRVVMYNRLAEIAGEYCKKGRSVYIEGKLKTRKWQDKDGQDKYTTEIVADQMQLLGGRDDAAQQHQQASRQQNMGIAAMSAQQQSLLSAQQASAGTINDIDDDIPF